VDDLKLALVIKEIAGLGVKGGERQNDTFGRHGGLEKMDGEMAENVKVEKADQDSD
jgi:hypothetical protein